MESELREEEHPEEEDNLEGLPDDLRLELEKEMRQEQREEPGGSDLEGVQETSEEYMTPEEQKHVLELAVEAGRVLLKNGAEIFRVEETIEHICHRFQIEKVDTFIMSNGILITAEYGGKDVYAKVKHVPLSGIHLGIVTEVNNLSREIASGKIDVNDAMERLKEIEQMPAKRDIHRILAAGLGSGCFCYLLKGNVWESMISFCIGMILYVFVIFAERHKTSKIIVNIIGGALITILAVFAKFMDFPFPVSLDKMIIGSILPLVPGVAFTNAIRDIANSDFISGTVRMIDALLVFVYMAIGVGFILGLYYNILGGTAL